MQTQMGYQTTYAVPQPGMHYTMPGITPQAAAMAATAAASGQGYPYLPSDSSLQNLSSDGRRFCEIGAERKAAVTSANK